MSSHNSFSGYVKLPGKDLYPSEVRVDFNARINGADNEGRIEGFSLRMFTLEGIGKAPELSVTLTAEQWLDLIEAMRQEFENAQASRKEIEGLD